MTLLLVLQLALTVPNPDLTPGVVRPLTLHQICTTRWGTDRRRVTVAMKQQVAAAYGLPWSQRHTVEFDHLIPRSLGGADAVANLWPQPWADAHAKDVVEARLARGICDGSIPLAAARAQMQQWGRR
jgi:hypothetical protein